MKFSIIALCLCIAAGIKAQHSITVPAVVSKAFNTQFPAATSIKWGKENAKEYEADFKVSNTTMSANFSTDGTWMETETEIAVSGLPASVSNAIHTKYPGATISGADKIEKPGGKIIYEANIKIKGKSKELLLYPDGSFTK